MAASICLNVPEHESDTETYPGTIKPGSYDLAGLVALLRENKDDADAIQFIADMLEQ